MKAFFDAVDLDLLRPEQFQSPCGELVMKAIEEMTIAWIATQSAKFQSPCGELVMKVS